LVVIAIVSPLVGGCTAWVGLLSSGFLQIGPGVPVVKRWLGVYRTPVNVDLEVEMTADGAGVSGLPDRADSLAGPDAIAALDARRTDHVGVEIAALLTLAVEQQVVAVEDRVIARAQHAAGRHGNQGRAAGGDDVEAFVGAAAAARRPEFADGSAGPVRPLDREDVGEELGSASGTGSIGCRRSKDGEKGEGEKERALQWCSMTRSTMLYSFASSAVMK
jgi:hypothetical protein